MTNDRLKLRAKDDEDVQVISAILQDSIAPVCDMIFDADTKNFIMVVHRLRREEETGAEMDRICCAVNVSGVDNVQIHGIDLTRREQMLDLLAAMPAPGRPREDGDTEPEHKNLDFIFAGEAKIRLQLGSWSIIVEDFGEPWPASCKPCHDGESALPDAQGL